MAVQWRQDSSIYKRYIRELVSVYQQRSDVRAFTEILLSVFAIFIFGVFAIRPTLVTIATLNGEIDSKKETLTKMNTKIDNLLSAQQLYESKRSLISLLSTTVPTGSDPLAFANQIDQIAEKNSVEVSNLSLDSAPILNVKGVAIDPIASASASVDETAVLPVTEQSIPMTISVEGEFENVSGFLSDFESMRRPVMPLSLLIALSSAKDSTKILLTISGKVPYLP